MELYVQAFHFIVSYLDIERISSLVQLCFDVKTSAGRGFWDHFHDSLMAGKRTPPPVHADMRKEMMLDLIAFARSVREMGYCELQTGLPGKSLQFDLPQSNPIAVASSTVGRDQQFCGLRIDLQSHPKPPTPDTGNREAGGVVVRSHVDPAHVLADVVYSIGNYLGRLWRSKIVDFHVFGFPFRLPLPPAVLELAYKVLVLRGYRNGWLRTSQEPLHTSVDIAKLLVPIRVTGHLNRLSISLQTVVQPMKQLGHTHVTDMIAFTSRRLRQLPGALACPSQRRAWVTAGYWINECFQFLKNLRIIFCYILSAAPGLRIRSGMTLLLCISAGKYL